MDIGIFARTFRRSDLPATLDALVDSGLATMQFNFGLTGGPSMPDAIGAELAAASRSCARRRRTSNLACGRSMRIFKHRAPAGDGAPGEELRRTVSSVVILGEAADARGARRAELLRVVAEGVVLQDQAVAVLVDIRARAPLAEVARRGGPLARRFLRLREQLPAPVDADMARQCATASVVLDHHGHVIVHALELLAADWRRSPGIRAQLERLDGLGAPAERLDALYTELTH
jgi:hypothetical protein